MITKTHLLSFEIDKRCSHEGCESAPTNMVICIAFSPNGPDPEDENDPCFLVWTCDEHLDSAVEHMVRTVDEKYGEGVWMRPAPQLTPEKKP